MKLKKTPPEKSVYANWSNSTAVAGTYSTIHHPGGGLKKISWGVLQNSYDCWMTSTTNFNCTPSSNGNFARLSWSTAGAETGSHGAGLFQIHDRLAATLVGGSGNPCYADYGYFSLFKNAYKEGNLGKWLNPVPEPEPVVVAPFNYLLLKD